MAEPFIDYVKSRGDSIKLIVPLKVKALPLGVETPLPFADFEWLVMNAETPILQVVEGCTFSVASTAKAAASATATTPNLVVADHTFVEVFIPGSVNPSSIMGKPTGKLYLKSHRIGVAGDYITRLVINFREPTNG
jgi:hypothetical protein